MKKNKILILRIPAIMLLFSGLFLNSFSQQESDTARLRMNDISTLSMVDTLEYYDEGSTDSIIILSGGVASILASESMFANWVQGGQNSLNSIAKIRLFHNKRKYRNYYGHTFNAALGYIYANGDFRKTEDRLDYYFKYSSYIRNKFYFSTMLNVKTQILPGYNYPDDSVKISNFLAPAYVLLKIGFDYMPGRNIKIFLAPLSSKVTIVADQNLANNGYFGVISGSFDIITETFLSLGNNLRYEFGGFVVIGIKADITRNWRLETELDLFSNYKNDPWNVDVDWQLESRLKLSKLFSINFESRMIYDHDIKMKVDEGGKTLEGPRVQFKQFLGLGANFKF